MAHKTKIVKVLTAAFVGLNSIFLANTTFADPITNSGLVNQQLLKPRAKKEELNQIAEAAKTNEKEGAVTLETFRKYVLKKFELEYPGRKVDFEKNRDEANRLYDAIKKFEKENAEVSAQDFPSKIKNYINQKNANKQIEVLEDEEFKNKLNSNPDYLQLHYIDFLDGESEKISDIKKILAGDFSNYSKSGLSADDGQMKVWVSSSSDPGFNEKLVLGEFAVNSKKFNVLNAEHLDELMAILKYNHPEEMGFYKEIASAVDANKMRKRIEKENSKMSPELQERIFFNGYFSVPWTLFDSTKEEKDAIYRKITGSSLLDVNYVRDDIDENSLQLALEEKFPGHEKTIREEIHDLYKKAYCTNKTYEILRNRELLTKLLGYDALCDSSVVDTKTMKRYTIVNYNCLEFVNKNERNTPKPEERYIPKKTIE